jgi:putative Ca2+/H+ antiporter (TMEM165/GDT1 family)
MVEIPESHPLASWKGQHKFVWQIGWRWMLAGVLGSLLDIPVLSFVVGLCLAHLLYRTVRVPEFWQPWASSMLGTNLWIARAGIVLVVGFALIANRLDAKFLPYLLGWVGFCFATLIETYLVPPILAEGNGKL